MWTTGGVVSTVHEKVAGAALVLPAGSVAHTEKVWSPFVTTCEYDDPHETGAALSILHWNVDPSSDEWYVKLAPVLAVGEFGDESIPTVGGVTSTLQSYVAGLPTLLSESVART